MPTILLKKSDTPGSVPGTANLTNLAGGVEVAVNTADKRVYSMTSASAVIELGTNPSSLTCADVSATVLRAGSATITNLIATSASITTLTNNPTFSGGTANGVLYLNGSKVATSGSAFVFDGTNVGIGTSSPGYKLDVVGAINASAASPTGFNHALRTTGVTTGRSQIYLNNTSGDLVLGIEGSTAGASYAGTAAYSAFAATTGANPFYVITNSAIRATFDSSGNLGIGTSSPGAKLEIRDTNATAIFSNSATRYGFVQWENTGGELRIGTDGVFGLRFDTNAQRRMTLDSSGNLGLGVTPSTSWFASSKAIQIGSAGAPYMGLVQQTTTTCDGYMLWGARLSGDRVFQYVTTGDAVAAYRQNAGTHAWFNAASGTAGNTISSFTQAMTLDASGNLLVGTTSAPNGGSVRDVVLHNTNSATTYLKISNASTGATASDGFDLIMGTSSDAYAYNRENGPLIFGTNNTERARITNVGNFGIANTDPNYNLSVGTPGSTAASYIQLGSTTTGTGSLFFGDTTGTGSGSFRGYVQYDHNIDALIFGSAATNQARISSTGLFLVNIDSSTGYGDGHRIYRNVSEGGFILSVDGGGEYAALFQDVASGGYSTAAAGIWVGKNSSNSRSINAGGTVNASGADYAEYMEKAGDFVIAKGDVCGIDADGKLTNVYANAVAFVVKSTNPSYVGGDSWGAGYKDDPEGLEAARQKVDRIAFSGQVPVNVLGATPGQYIVPVNDNGAIKGVAVSNPSFEQYQTAVGKVIAIEDDGRARIIVKIA